MRLSNKDLQSFYKIINKRFYNNALPADIVVRFDDADEMEDHDEGEYIEADKQILIHKDFRRHPDVAMMVLVHETAHVALPEYVGWTDKDEHGHRFEALIGELYRKGAYDGLL